MSGSDSAFPALIESYKNRDDNFSHSSAGGLTKRELFAAMALSGLLANPKSEPEDIKHNQIVAVRNADGLIEQLGREQ